MIARGGRDLWFDEAFALARLHEHVYLEVSGPPPRRLLEYFHRPASVPGKAVFWSDFPVVRDLAANIEAVRQLLPLPDDFIDDVLGGTAPRLLGAGA